MIFLLFAMIVFALTKEQVDIARTCDTTGITEIFDKFSDSEQTGYKIDNKTGDVIQYICKDGKWIPTQEWADKNGIDTKTIQLGTSFLQPEQYEKALTCDIDGTTQIFDKFDEGLQIGYVINSATGEVTEYNCLNGKWVQTIKWCEDNKIDISTIKIWNSLKPSNKDEQGREIVYSANPVINANESKQVVVGDKIINITVQATNTTTIIQERLKCICEKACTIQECISP